MADILCQLREEATQALLENGTAGVGGLETRELGYATTEQEFSFRLDGGGFARIPSKARLLRADSAPNSGAKIVGYFPSNGMSATDVQAAIDELRASVVGIGSLGGAGTAGTIPEWATSSTLGNSTLARTAGLLSHSLAQNDLTMFLVNNTTNGTAAGAGLLLGGPSLASASMWLFPAAYTGNAELANRHAFQLSNSILGSAFQLGASADLRVYLGTPAAGTLFHLLNNKGLSLRNIILSTDADGSYGGIDTAFSVTKNDANTRTFAGLKLRATLNTGGSNLNTTLNLLDFDTVNTAATGLAVNLMRLRYGGAAKFLITRNAYVGINTENPLASLHVAEAIADAAFAINGAGDTLLLENNDDAGMTILCPTDKIASIFFAKVGAASQGALRYHMTNDEMQVWVNGAQRAKFTNNSFLHLSTSQVLGPRIPGWTAATGTPTRSGFATGSATTQAVAEALKALIDDLMTHGLIGA